MKNNENNLFLGLVHYPVYNKNMETVATSITNMDIHDISRSAATFGVEKFFLIHPLTVQHEIAQKMINYWQEGFGSHYNPDRKEALRRTLLTESIPEAIDCIKEKRSGNVKIIVTDARIYPNSIDYPQMKEIIEKSEDNYLLLFGTGWGLDSEIMNNADYRLFPINGRGDYNHLSVRSAVAIILDRLRN